MKDASEMTDENSPKHAVLRIWSGFFYVFFGWSCEQVEKWATTYHPDISNPYSFFYHDTPLSYVCPLLIPSSLRKKLGGLKAFHFGHEIEAAICNSSPPALLLDDSFDWQAAKQRVEDLLNQRGETLANVDDSVAWRLGGTDE